MATHVHFKAVTKRFKTSLRTVCEDLDLLVEEGDKLVLLGPSGSGKTTLLKMAAGLVGCDEGQVLVRGKMAARQERKALGLMLSTELLYGALTGLENLLHTGRLYRIPELPKRIEEVVARWGIKDYLDNPVFTYSNGMKGRLALARATLHEPTLLLLDEPTAYLDSDGVTRLQHFMRDYAGTLLITTHDSHEIVPFSTRVFNTEKEMKGYSTAR